MSFMFQPCRPCCKGVVKPPPPPPSPGTVVVTTLDSCTNLQISTFIGQTGVTYKLIGPDGTVVSTAVDKFNSSTSLLQGTLTGITQPGQYTVVASYNYAQTFSSFFLDPNVPFVFDNGGISTVSANFTVTQANIAQFRNISLKLTPPLHTVNLGIAGFNASILPVGTPILVDGVQKAVFVTPGMNGFALPGGWVSVEPHNKHTISVPANARFSGWSTSVGPFDACFWYDYYYINASSDKIVIPQFCNNVPISTTLILTDSTYGNCTLTYSPTSASWVGTKTVTVAACGSCVTQSVPVTYELLPGGNASGTGITVYLNLSCPIYTGPSNFLTFGLVGCPWPDINNSSVSTQHFGFNANLTNLVCPTSSNKLQVSFDVNVQPSFNLGGILVWQCARTTTFFITEG